MHNGISLHIGLNNVDPGHYPVMPTQLAGCVSDADAMLAIAQAHGFQATRLIDAQATREAVITALDIAAQRLGDRDTLWVSYSGHGGQVPDLNGDDKTDFLDETWCLWNGQLLDDELYVQWLAFKPGVRILLISDSCHSGTVAKDPYYSTSATHALMDANKPMVYRFMGKDSARATYYAHRDFYDNLQKVISKPMLKVPLRASLRLISGCQDDQFSADGAFNGLFTSTLLHVWDAGKFKGGYKALHRAIRKAMPAQQRPNYLALGHEDAQFDLARPFGLK